MKTILVLIVLLAFSRCIIEKETQGFLQSGKGGKLEEQEYDFAQVIVKNTHYCPSVRPKIITKELMPVCGISFVKGRKLERNFNNWIEACSNNEVEYYLDGKCGSQIKSEEPKIIVDKVPVDQIVKDKIVVDKIPEIIIKPEIKQNTDIKIVQQENKFIEDKVVQDLFEGVKGSPKQLNEEFNLVQSIKGIETPKVRQEEHTQCIETPKVCQEEHTQCIETPKVCQEEHTQCIETPKVCQEEHTQCIETPKVCQEEHTQCIETPKVCQEEHTQCIETPKVCQEEHTQCIETPKVCQEEQIQCKVSPKINQEELEKCFDSVKLSQIESNQFIISPYQEENEKCFESVKIYDRNVCQDGHTQCIETPKVCQEEHTQCIETPKVCQEEHTQCIETPKVCQEEHTQCIETPKVCQEEHTQCIETPKVCQEEHTQCIETPNVCIDSKQYVDNEQTCEEHKTLNQNLNLHNQEKNRFTINQINDYKQNIGESKKFETWMFDEDENITHVKGSKDTKVTKANIKSSMNDKKSDVDDFDNLIQSHFNTIQQNEQVRIEKPIIQLKDKLEKSINQLREKIDIIKTPKLDQLEQIKIIKPELRKIEQREQVTFIKPEIKKNEQAEQVKIILPEVKNIQQTEQIKIIKPESKRVEQIEQQVFIKPEIKQNDQARVTQHIFQNEEDDITQLSKLKLKH
jgi:hypothetical protein